MLAPPPEDGRAKDLGALHGEKRDRYLKSLEDKLQHLERPGKDMTSKDILHSLSEARDDHLRQQNDNIVDLGTLRNVALAKHDPWNVSVTLPPTNTNCSENQQQQTECCLDSLGTELEDGNTEEETCFSNFARICCDGTRGRNWRGKLQYACSNLPTEEEGEYLMDCDELGLTWESNS